MSESRCYGCMKLKTESPICEHCGYDARTGNAPHQLPVDTVLMGRYRLGKVLGQGGFGITYIGWDNFLEIPVAVKEYYPTGLVMRDSSYSLSVSSGGGDMDTRFQNNRERFLREAKALARFENTPQVVQVSNYFLDNNTAYIVMEFVEGVDLKRHVKNKGGKLSAEETFALLRPVMDALDKVHATGLVHRDISPDNIMLLPNGGVKLIDFGAVRDVQHADAEQQLSKSTEAILKQGYAPIEQYQKRGSLGPWTDVHALCATIYYCLTGEVPPDVPERMMGEEAFSWNDVPSLTEQQRAALEKGMALLPKNRTQSIRQLSKDLFETPALKPDPEPKPTPKPQRKPAKKKAPLWKIAAAGLAVAALVLGGMLVSSLMGQDSEEPVIEKKEGTAAAAEPSAVVENHTYTENRMAYGGDDTVFVPGSDLRREEIVSIHFLDSLTGMPEDAWDMSAEQNGSVMAWTVPEGTRYHLYIAGEGGVMAPVSCERLFYNYSNAVEIEFGTAFHTEQTTNMSRMFKNCSAVTSLNLTGFDTSQVTSMYGMFLGCYHLERLDVSSFDTANVYNMEWMFACGTEEDEEKYVCTPYTSELKALDLSNFDTSSAVIVDGMFYGCVKLEYLDISSFQAPNAKDLGGMFMYCDALEYLDISGLQIRQGISGDFMFYNAPLKKLYVSETFHLLNQGELELKADCEVIEGPMPEWEKQTALANSQSVSMTARNTLMEDPLPPAYNAKYRHWSDTNGEEVMYQEPVFRSELTKDSIVAVTFLDTLEGAPEDAWDVSAEENGLVLAWAAPEGNGYHLYIGAEGGVDAPQNCQGLFAGYYNMKSIRFNGAFDTSHVTDMQLMFFDCRSLTELDLSGFDTANVTDMSNMFQKCHSLKTLDVSGFQTAKVTSMRGMFSLSCDILEEGEDGGFYVTGHEDSQLKTMDVSSFDTSSVTTMESMFEGCCNLTQLDLSNFDTAKVTNMYSVFMDCRNLKKLDISGFNTENVVYMGHMFRECRSLTELDLRHFDTSNVTNMATMFYRCENLRKLDISNFDRSKVTEMNGFVDCCYKLETYLGP